MNHGLIETIRRAPKGRDGDTRPFSALGTDEYKFETQRGTACRMLTSDGTPDPSPFGTNLIQSVDPENVDPETQVITLCRPYGFIGSAETTCPIPLVGWESYRVTARRFVNSFALVLTSRGEPMRYTT
jgi:hypothetical protein